MSTINSKDVNERFLKDFEKQETRIAELESIITNKMMAVEDFEKYRKTAQESLARQAARIAELEDQLMEAGKAAMKIQAQFEQQAEREAELLGHIETLELQICRFKTSNAQLREALEFYAEKDAWAEFRSGGNIFGECEGDSMFAFDKGEDSPWATAMWALKDTRQEIDGALGSRKGDNGANSFTAPPSPTVQGCDFHGCYGSVTGLHHSACRLAAVCPDCSIAMSPAFDQGQGVYFCFGCHKRKAPQAAQEVKVKGFTLTVGEVRRGKPMSACATPECDREFLCSNHEHEAYESGEANDKT